MVTTFESFAFCLTSQLYITFRTDDGKETTVKDYFAAKGCLLQYPSLNCITTRTKKREISLPMEFCSVTENQVLNRKDGSIQVTKMIKYAATSTDERKNKIINLLAHFCHSQSPFGLSAFSWVVIL
ncbi:protein argonaute-2-like [Glossina fuscipes]|uniref:Protein argonaute-2-like n=1 Tax=Glossina fuscipes TaxID=7396 RepID=A0A8U0WEP3_9MUSC|nr:protein argonaute-2-like [Glossina fuscipes]